MSPAAGCRVSCSSAAPIFSSACRLDSIGRGRWQGSLELRSSVDRPAGKEFQPYATVRNRLSRVDGDRPAGAFEWMEVAVRPLFDPRAGDCLCRRARGPQIAAVGHARLFAQTAAYKFRCELTLSARSRRLLRAYGSAEQRTVRRFGTARSDRRPELVAAVRAARWIMPARCPRSMKPLVPGHR
jgi:hypothetical protein